MSIASELTALAANKAAIKAAIEAKNPSTMPTDALSQWPTSIASIGGGGHEGWIYGYVIDESDSNPATRVTYIEDNADFDPLYMDFTNDALVWGDWQDFVEEYFRPAMLKSNGTIDYYLDPNDLTKKADGVTASDVANTSYDGNAMLIVKPIFYNIERIGAYKIQVRFSNIKQGPDWLNWTHLKSDGTYADFCGWPLFEGVVISSKLRSISGASSGFAVSMSLGSQYAAAVANGSNWHMTTYADELMIRMLIPLLIKSTDADSLVGIACSAAQTTGALSDKGYFWGAAPGSGSTRGVKFLGMEHCWSVLWRRCVGAISNANRLYVKMTPSTADGTSANGFVSSNVFSDYSGYLIGTVVDNSNKDGKTIIHMLSDPLSPLIPNYIDGTDFSAGYKSAAWVATSNSLGSPTFAAGGNGAFGFGNNGTTSTSFAYYSASLSYHFY